MNGERRRIYGDHLGQLVVEPECNGACTVDLTYDGGAEMRIARILSLMTLASVMYADCVQCRQSRRYAEDETESGLN